MGFEISNNISKKLTLEQLTQGLDKVKDRKKIDRITFIFNKYNTNNEGVSADALDVDEQVSLMNDYHNADGNNDAHITRRGMRKSGIKGEYKAYKDFMEAYQKALYEVKSNTYDLSFKDDTTDGTKYTRITAAYTKENSAIKYQYINSDEGLTKVKTTYSFDNVTQVYNNKGLLIKQVAGNTAILYGQYDSETKDANPGIIMFSSDDGNWQTLKRQDDGTYLDTVYNEHYRLNSDKLYEFEVDEQNRITSEYWGENSYDYTYEEDSKAPATVTVSNADGTKVYTREETLYTSKNGNDEEYFTFDAETRQFTKTEAPQQQDSVAPKTTRPKKQSLIKMTAGWKNQRVNPDSNTIEEFNSMSEAKQVLDKLINGNEQTKDFKFDEEELLSDLIKNNPSVFNSEGIIYSDARWDRLDFPSDLSKYKTEK